MSKFEFNIKPLRKDIKLPVRANPTDAGLDVFFNPSNDELAGVWIDPGDNWLFETGVSVEFPSGHAMEVKNRSSMGHKKKLVVGAHLIDSSYRGEVFIDLHNIGTEAQYIKRGDKIAQLVIYPIVTPKYEIVDELSDTSRGDGGFGSTGQ